MYWQTARRLLRSSDLKYATPMSKDTESLRSRDWDKQPTIYNRQWQVLLCFHACSYFTLYVHRNNPQNLCNIAHKALEHIWKPVFSRHHDDVRPRDCDVGGDNEQTERRDEDSESFLHQHFPAKPQVKVMRSISIIILWRDQKSVLIKNDCCWRVNDSSEFD